MNLTLPLKRKWFDMTSARIKREDYREINDYWCRRLLDGYKELSEKQKHDIIRDMSCTADGSLTPVGMQCLSYYGVRLKLFTHNILTLGYPKGDDHSRRLALPHGGIEIGKGKEEWGAEKGKNYFVIKHKD